MSLIQKFLLILILNTCQATNWSSKQIFITDLLPKIEQANRQIILDRKLIIQNHLSTQPTILKQITAIAYHYKLKNWQYKNPQHWQQLLLRVNTIPNSIILSQAILESGWGKSRFAVEGNNLFGIWCHTPGCGIIPKHRDASKTHEVKKFKSFQASIEHHLLNLNTNPAYQQLRQARAKTNSGTELCLYLNKYSAQGSLYPEKLIKLIKAYNLQQWDNNVEY